MTTGHRTKSSSFQIYVPKMWTLLLGLIFGHLAPAQFHPVLASVGHPDLRTEHSLVGGSLEASHRTSSSNEAVLGLDNLVMNDSLLAFDPEDITYVTEGSTGLLSSGEGSGIEEIERNWDYSNPKFNLLPNPTSQSSQASSTAVDVEVDFATSPKSGNDDEDIYMVASTGTPTTTEIDHNKRFQTDLKDSSTVVDANPIPSPRPTQKARPTIEELENEYVFNPSVSTTLRPSHSPISDIEEEGLIFLSSHLSVSTTSGQSKSQGNSHTPSSDLTNVSGLVKSRMAKPGTEQPSTKLVLPLTSNTAPTTTVRIHQDNEGSGSEILHHISTTVTDTTGDENQRNSNPVNEEHVERVVNNNGLQRIAANTVTVPHETVDVKATPSAQRNAFTAGWWIIPVFVMCLGVFVSVCIIIATSKSWNKTPQISEKDEVARVRSGDEQEKKGFLSHGKKPKENGHIGHYTIIPLGEIPDKEPLD